MAIIKVIELMGSSTQSWEDAAQQVINHASKTLRNIRSIYIKEQSAEVENNKITEFRVTSKVSFVLDDRPS
ncbi:MAG: dodecin domain-containing protein [Flavisolibacter sp.]|nr:dodecin domain-containing protein [Flavisolibacter sp.]MBD0374724.1 dodecin domain-containing protein [Flavisolibacter sp.]